MDFIGGLYSNVVGLLKKIYKIPIFQGICRTFALHVNMSQLMLLRLLESMALCGQNTHFHKYFHVRLQGKGTFNGISRSANKPLPCSVLRNQALAHQTAATTPPPTTTPTTLSPLSTTKNSSSCCCCKNNNHSDDNNPARITERHHFISILTTADAK